MAKIIVFPGAKDYKLTRQYCECGGVLELWMDDDDNCVGLCTRCHLGVGDEMVQIVGDDDGKTRH